MALRLWRLSLPAGGTLVEAYLHRRGIAGPVPPTLRFLPACRHAPTGTDWPAMVAAVSRWPERSLCGVHRTYLRPDGTGKAPVEPAKITLGPIRGGAVRLAAPTAPLWWSARVSKACCP